MELCTLGLVGLENGPLAVRKGAFFPNKKGMYVFFYFEAQRSLKKHPSHQDLGAPLSCVGYIYGFCSFIENCLSSLCLMMYISAQ